MRRWGVEEDFWGCGWIIEEKTSCWKNGTLFERITKREPARSPGRDYDRMKEGWVERESLRDLAHSKWLKDRGNWILAFDRAALGLLIERLVFSSQSRSFSFSLQLLPVRIRCLLSLSSQSFKHLFAFLLLFYLIIHLSSVFNYKSISKIRFCIITKL